MRLVSEDAVLYLGNLGQSPGPENIRDGSQPTLSHPA